ncbi:MFS transporter [Xenorhabdus doucetiae]|uniref:MFS transporter n=1 Tax=Xenorhabdus doucetiae TaxID=351671 RepID=A0A068QS19_9GAMM|nr:MFS transporter [Xenorhabdus doucetiae]TYP08839.1 MFS transporter [Xenorhabdus doucetiae]CDG16635.1 membrane protein of unknown function [Xenorhabdus doucetiae]
MVKNIIISRFTGSLAYYSFVPFLAIYLVKAKEISQADAAIAVSLLILSGRVSSLFSGIVIIRTGLKRLLLCGYAGCSAVCVLLTLLEGCVALSLASMIIGISFALCSIASKILIAGLSQGGKGLKAFGYLNVAVNVASALGTVIADQTSRIYINLLPLLAGVVLAATALLIAKLDEQRLPLHRKKLEHVQTVSGQIRMRLLFILASLSPWLIYGFFFNGISYQLATTSATGHRVSILFSLNAGLIIVFQTIVLHYIDRIRKDGLLWVSCINQLVLCASLMFYQLDSFEALIMFVVVFTFSEMVWSPLNDYLSAEFAGPDGRESFMPVCNFVWGIAESLGTFIGISGFNTLGKNLPIVAITVAAIILATHFALARAAKIGIGGT